MSKYFNQPFVITAKPKSKKDKAMSEKLFNLKKGDKDLTYFIGSSILLENRYLSQVARYLLENKQITTFQKRFIEGEDDFQYIARGLK